MAGQLVLQLFDCLLGKRWGKGDLIVEERRYSVRGGVLGRSLPWDPKGTRRSQRAKTEQQRATLNPYFEVGMVGS